MPVLDTIIGQASNSASGLQASLDNHYSPIGGNWYKSFPYSFKAVIDGVQHVVNLPIAPQNLSIVTHYATNTIATLYGTVEEHSEQRYFDIAISGTTGFAPKYVTSEDAVLGAHGKGRRLSYVSGSVFSNLAGGFFASTLGKLDQAANKASDAYYAAMGKARPFQPGVFFDSSGYAAFHNLYRFFLEYKRSAASGNSTTDGGSTGATGFISPNISGKIGRAHV